MLMPEDSKMLQVKSEVWSFSLITSEQAIGPAGMLEISQETQSPIEITGYQPVSKVEIYLEVANFNAMGQLSEFLFRAMTRVTIGTYETDLEGKLSAELVIPKTVAGGSYAMTVVGVDESGDAVTFSLPIAVKQSVDLSFGAWTKKFGLSQGKLYAKNPIGQGKVQFFVNGKEVAWVRAESDDDRKLRKVTEGAMSGVSYLVRTVNLVRGKNALEIYLDGKRVWRAAYTLR